MAERNDGEDRDRAFDGIIHEYYRSIESGEIFDRQAFIDKHPNFEAELHSFFADLEHLGEAGDQPKTRRSSGLDPTLASGRNGETLHPGDSVRYIGEYRVLEEIDRG